MGEHIGIIQYVCMYVCALVINYHTYIHKYICMNMAVLECGGCHHREITGVSDLTSPPSSQQWKYHTTHIQGQLMNDITVAPSTCNHRYSVTY